MMNLIQKISGFFLKDVENNNETKQAAVLVRILSFVMGIYFLFQVIVFCITGDLLLDVLSVVCLAGYVHSFIGTYKERTREVRYFIIALTLLWIVIYVYLLGWDFGVQHFLFVLLLFILLTSYFGTAKKVLVTVGLCVIRLSLYLYTFFYLPVKAIENGNGIFFQSVNTILIFTAVAWMIIFVSGHSLVMEKKLIDYNEKIRQLADIDPLTGLLNRRGIIEKLLQIAPEGKHWDTEYINIAIGDIDFFKQVNDTYGHEAGDVVLQKLGEILQDFMSKNGFIARWGGEEFLFVFHGINGDDSMHKLEELRKIIAAMQIEHENQIIRITITIGLQEHMAGDSVEHTIIEADKKLYIGKQTGRNKVVF